MRKNFKKLFALTCTFTMLTSTVAFGATTSTGDSIIENDNSVAPSYLNCILPSIADNTYDFTIDVDGLLAEFDKVGEYDSSSNVFFDAQKEAATLELTAGGDLYIIDKVVDSGAEAAIAGLLVGEADETGFAETKYYVWQPDTTNADTIAAGKGTWTQLTADNLADFFDIELNGAGDEIAAVTMKEDFLSMPVVWDGNIYAESYIEIHPEAAATHVTAYDEAAGTITTLAPGLYADDAGTAAEIADLTYTPATRQFVNVSDVAFVVNKSTFPVAVKVDVAITNENHGLVFSSSADFSGEGDDEANIYMAIQSDTHAAPLDSEGSASAYYILNKATNSTVTYQDTTTDALTGSHNYFQYESYDVRYDVQPFTLTATANDDFDWDAYVAELTADDAEITKPEIEVVYDFVQVEAGEDANTYVDEEDILYTTDGSDGWAEVESATPVVRNMTLRSGSLTYTFTDKVPTGDFTAVTVDSTARNGQIGNGNIKYENGTVTINSTGISTCGLSTSGTHTIVVTIGGKNYTLNYKK